MAGKTRNNPDGLKLRSTERQSKKLINFEQNQERLLRLGRPHG